MEMLVLLNSTFTFFLWIWITECLNGHKFDGIATEDLAWSTVFKKEWEKDGGTTATLKP